MAGFKTAALIDRDVDEDRARLHRAEHVACDQLRRFGAGDQHRADYQIGLGNAFGEIRTVRETRFGARLEKGADAFEYFGVAVEDRDIGAESRRHLRCVEADDAAADDADFARRDAGNAAEQHAAAAMRLFERSRAGLNRHAPRNLAHRFEQRQAAMRAGDGFIGDAHRTRFHQVARLVGIGGKVEIGVEDLPFAEHRALTRLRFLDLYHHVALREDFLGGLDDFGARLDIIAIMRTDARTRAGLD